MAPPASTQQKNPAVPANKTDELEVKRKMINKLFSCQNPDWKKKLVTGQGKRRTVRSEEIFQGEREITIAHGDIEYRLQITKAGKLILNK